jgi:2-haloacid dehalogenase
MIAVAHLKAISHYLLGVVDGAAALFGCAPGEVIMVASHPSDLAGAARYGLRTCYVSRKLEYREGRIVEPAPTPGTFDLMVRGVDELADLLLR